MMNCFYTIFNLTTEVEMYTNLTGHFPHQSSNGHNYIVVTCKYNGNAVLVGAFKTKQADSIRNLE